MSLSVNEARFGYNHVTSQDAANANMSIVGAGVYLDPLYGSKCAMSFADANTLVISTGAIWANGRFVTVSTPETVNIANGQSGYKRNDIICIHCHINNFGNANATESYEIVALRGTQVADDPTDPAITNAAISNLVEDSYAPIARVKLDGLTPDVESLMTMLPALMDLITTDRIADKAITKAKLADHSVGQTQLETSVWNSISQAVLLSNNATLGRIGAAVDAGQFIQIRAKTNATDYLLYVSDGGINLYDVLQGRSVHSIPWTS